MSSSAQPVTATEPLSTLPRAGVSKNPMGGCDCPGSFSAPDGGR